jgi:hypothetical protein
VCEPDCAPPFFEIMVSCGLRLAKSRFHPISPDGGGDGGRESTDEISWLMMEGGKIKMTASQTPHPETK